MTDQEKTLMGAHATYWRARLEDGGVIVFGPVLDPKGPWGVGIVEMSNAEEVADFGRKDPIIKAGIGFKFEYYPMASAVYLEHF